MKRKRGKGKPRPNKSRPMFENESDLNMGYPEADNRVQNDVRLEFDSGINTQTLQSDCSMRKQQLCLEKQVNEKSEKNANSLGNRTCQEESRFLNGDPIYDEEELSAALLVLKIIMKSDAAQPFNVPVDPDLLGIPDYFDIIDTPMDFGTIRKNLEDGAKYVNSEAVFKDVQLIWENCSKYNKKGSYVLELMKRVKTNFMKFWTEANLYVEPVRTSKGSSHLQPPHSRRSKECIDESCIDSAACQSRSQMSPYQLHSRCPSLIYRQIQKSPGSPTNDRMQNEHAVRFPVGQDIDNFIHQEQPDPPLLNNNQRIMSPVDSYMRHSKHGHVDGPHGPSTYDRRQNKHAQRFPVVQDTDNCIHQEQPDQASLNNNQRIMSPVESYMRHSKHGHNDGPPGPPTYNRRQNKHTHRFPLGQDTDDSIHHELPHQALLNNNLRIMSPVESYMKHSKIGHNDCYSVGSDTDHSAHKLDNLVDHIQLQSQKSPKVFRDRPLDASKVGQRKLELKNPLALDNPITSCRLPDPRSLGLEQSQHKLNGERNQPQQDCDQLYSLLPQPDTSSNKPQASVQHNTSYNQPQPSVQQPDSSSSQSQAPQQQSEPENDITSTGNKSHTRTRGPTRCLKLWNSDGKRIYVTTNESGEPVGDKASKLISFLGTVARDGLTAPLIYADWRAMPEANKEKMWQQVQLKFDIGPICKDWVLKSLSRKWRDWKAKLKIAHYNTHATDEERIADRDERVPLDQWVALVSYWSSGEGKERSARNKANRAQYKSNHATGTTSVTRLHEEEEESPFQEHNTQEHDTSHNTQKNQKETFTEIMAQDKHGQVVTNGLGSSCSKSKGPMPTRVEALRMVSVANSEVHEMKEKMAVMEQTCAQMAMQMSTMMAMISSMQKSQDKQNSSVDVTGTSASRDSPQQTGNDITFRNNSVANTPDASEDEPQQQIRSSKRNRMVQAPPPRKKMQRTRASRK